MIKRNSPSRQLKLSLVWLLTAIAMIPVQGFCISIIWNWFMPIIGLLSHGYKRTVCFSPSKHSLAAKAKPGQQRRSKAL